MLIELSGENFGCFRDEFRLSMLASDIDPGSDRGIVKVKVEGDDEPLRLLRAVAIYGPNASGKSTVLRAAGALRDLIGETERLRSDSPLEPYVPFALTPEIKAPVRLGAKAVIRERVYDYQVEFDRDKFISERLLWLKADGEVTLLDRAGKAVTGEWTNDKRFSLFTEDFRSNALLLSLADRLTPALASNVAVGFRNLLSLFTDPREAWWGSEINAPTAELAHRDHQFSKWLLSRLKFADIGVSDLRTEAVEEIEDENQRSSSGGPDIFYRLSLLHRGSKGTFPIPYYRESQGTQKLVDLAPFLYELANSSIPKTVFIDEIDGSLHPKLLQGLIQHFNRDIPSEQMRGQLVFVTHETSLLDAEAKNAILRRDQIYLTEKDASGAARLYSVADFKERNNLNLRRRYLQGRYGALPSLGVLAE